MKKPIPQLIGFLLWSLALYFAISFAQWNLNPGEWPADARFVFALFGLGFGAVMGFVAYVMEGKRL